MAVSEIALLERKRRKQASVKEGKGKMSERAGFYVLAVELSKIEFGVCCDDPSVIDV